jgi:hypothetical protein
LLFNFVIFLLREYMAAVWYEKEGIAGGQGMTNMRYEGKVRKSTKEYSMTDLRSVIPTLCPILSLLLFP